MRVVVELRRAPPDGVEGEVLRDGTPAPEHFSGWLELLRILEGIELEPAGDDETTH